MPIRLKCQCAKVLSVPDNLAGKAVKCPGCAKVLKVPAAAASPPAGAASKAATPKAAVPRPAAPRPAPQPVPSGGLDDLFDEEGFSKTVAAVCPACASEMTAGAVLCTKCGYHRESGTRMESHKTAGVDIDHGTLALMKAEKDMHAADALQAKLLKGAGMPWWALGLVLFMITSALTIGVIAVNNSRRVEGTGSMNPVQLFMQLSGGAFAVVSIAAMFVVLIHAFKNDIVKGFLCMFIPLYILYYVGTNFRETWKPFVVSIITSGIGGGFLAAAVGQ